MPRNHRPRIRVELLEDRSLPSFVAAHSFIVGPKGGSNSKPQAIVSADFNRDGLLDVATANKGGVFANSGNEGVSILLGTGKGSFKPAKNIYTTHSAYGIIAVDLNADGKLDLVTADKDDDAVTVLLGNGAGGFTIAGTFDAGKGPNAVAAGDFNGDGSRRFGGRRQRRESNQHPARQWQGQIHAGHRAPRQHASNFGCSRGFQRRSSSRHRQRQ